MKTPQPSAVVLAQLRRRVQVLEAEKSLLLRILWELAGMLAGHQQLAPAAGEEGKEGRRDART